MSAELNDLLSLLNADCIMSHEVAAQLSSIANNLRDKYPDFFVALNIGGSTTNGGAVAKAVLLNIDSSKAISDIDYGVIFSREISLATRRFLHQDMKRQLGQIGFAPCTTFNVENSYLIADDPYNMARRILSVSNEKYTATDLLMPFGIIFPFSERKQLQETVKETFVELGKLDLEFEKKIREAMNEALQ